MRFKKSLTIFVLSIIFITSHLNAKSLYVLSHEEYLYTFEINGDQLLFQKQITLPHHGYGPVDITIDNTSKTLFVSYEYNGGDTGRTIELFRAPSLANLDNVVLSGPTNVAGLAYDPARNRLYCADRNTKNIYAYDWDSDNLTLTAVTGNPFTLNELTYYACGLTINGDTLYVSDYQYILNNPGNTTDTIHAYDPNDNFSYIGPIYMGAETIGIDYSPADNYIYGGAFKDTSNILVKRSVDPNDMIRNSISSYAVGVAAHPDTPGRVITTNNNYSTGDESINIWDTSSWEDEGTQSATFTYDDTNDDNVLLRELAGLVIGPDWIDPFDIVVSDDITDCVKTHNQNITYTILPIYQLQDDITIFTTVRIYNTVPDELDFDAELNDPGLEYDPPSRTLKYSIDPNDFDPLDFYQLVMKTNKNIIPQSSIENTFKIACSIESSNYNFSTQETIFTNVCDCTQCGDIIYVDGTLRSDPNGVDWNHAYKNPQDALSVAWPCDRIWIKKGTYSLTSNPNEKDKTFNIGNSIYVYGGFEGIETELHKRDWLEHETILSGKINSFDNDPNRVDYVVTCNTEDSIEILDGFTVTGGGIAGIYCNNSSPLIQHNRIIQSSSGIYCDTTKNITILNNWIYKNGYGIYLDDPNQPATIQNNTIAYNNSAGIYKIGSTDPIISNCIIWDNTAENDLVNCNATYSLITDGDVGTGNLDGDPNYPPFDDIDDDDYHLDPDSDPNGIDAGNPDGDYAGQRDIDKQFRVLDGNDDGTERIDMGADEYCNETENDADFNEDEIVNYIDFAKFGIAWLQGPSDPNWSDGLYDLDGNGTMVDANDLVLFANEWLWMSCSKMVDAPIEEMMMSMGGGMELMSIGLAETPQPEPTIEEQIERAEGNLDWLNNLWETDEEVRDTIDEEDWEGMIESIEEWIEELEESL